MTISPLYIQLAPFVLTNLLSLKRSEQQLYLNRIGPFDCVLVATVFQTVWL